jgi:hypothetical protein
MGSNRVRRLALVAAFALLAAAPLTAQASRPPTVIAQTSIGGTGAATPTPAAGTTSTTTTGTSTGTAGATKAGAPPPPPKSAPLAPQGHTTATAVPAGYEKTSEDDSLALYVEKCSGHIAVVDKKSGIVWLSNPTQANAPAPPANCAPPAANAASSSSAASTQETDPVYTMQYTDYQRQVTKVLNSNWDPTPPVISKLPDGGTRETFTPKQQLQAGPITFAMDFHLNNGYFEVSIPQDQIKESINSKNQTGFYLVTLAPLPFFGAGADDEQGYMVIPDGSGALVNFKKIHPDYLQPFNQTIYGQDLYQPFNGQLGFGATQENAMMPAFGIAKQADADGKPVNGAFLALATQGQFDVNVESDPSGYITRYNHSSFQFLYRRTASIPRSVGVYVQRVATELLTGDRMVRYYLLSGSNATYSGMAAAYRSYIQNDLHVQPIKQADTPLNLDLLMGAQKKGLISYTLVPATTFSDAQQILQSLRERGVNNVKVTLNGWNRGGVFQASPNRMPADNRLGGNAGLQSLTTFARQLGVPIYLYDDYEDANGGEKGFFAHNDAMRGANKLPAFSQGAGTSQKFYLLNPIVEYNQFVLRDIPKEKALGVNGNTLQWFGQNVTYDTNEQHPLTREGYSQWNMKIADYIKQQLGGVAVNGGNTYILGHVQDARQVSVDSSHWQFEDQPVPFYEMAVHGFLTYTGTQANLRSDPQFEYLREIEYGAVPSFNLTYLPTSDLNRAIFTYRNWSSTWTDWLDALVREYQEVNVQLGGTFGQFMVDHRELAPNVFQTTYGNGTKVIVNYSNQRYGNGTVAVDALSYAVVH